MLNFTSLSYRQNLMGGYRMGLSKVGSITRQRRAKVVSGEYASEAQKALHLVFCLHDHSFPVKAC